MSWLPACWCPSAHSWCPFFSFFHPCPSNSLTPPLTDIYESQSSRIINQLCRSSLQFLSSFSLLFWFSGSLGTSVVLQFAYRAQFLSCIFGFGFFSLSFLLLWVTSCLWCFHSFLFTPAFHHFLVCFLSPAYLDFLCILLCQLSVCPVYAAFFASLLICFCSLVHQFCLCSCPGLYFYSVFAFSSFWMTFCCLLIVFCLVFFLISFFQ